MMPSNLMLRDHISNADSGSLRAVLQRFEPSEGAADRPILLRFEVILPDSFMRRLRLADGIYYAYAEDYIPGLDHVRTVFTACLKSQDWLIPLRTPITLADSSPVRSATTYEPSAETKDFERYAADSGLDSVFLARSAQPLRKQPFPTRHRAALHRFFLLSLCVQPLIPVWRSGRL